MNLIYVDLNKFGFGAVSLSTIGTRRDLERFGVTLEEGRALTFYMDNADENGNPDNLIFSGIVHFDEINQHWVAEIDWDRIKNESALTPEEKIKLGIA
jgi:hypothetical protein